jgi:PBSX family phage terminase large subunit
MSVLELAPPFAPTAKQVEFFRACVDVGAREVLFDGAIRSGKTQACCRAIAEWAVMHPNTTSLVARATYRELEDSTKKVMLRGDGGLPPILDRQLVAEERASDNKAVLRNGSEILFRSLEEQNVSKVLGPTYSAVFVDQIEELDSGPAGERLYDTLLGRLSDPNGPRKLIAAANPGPTTHWLHRRFVDPRSRGSQTRRVHATLLDNASHLPADYLEAMLATRETRPHWYRAFVLGEWGSFEGAAYIEFAEETHVVAPFALPADWVRLEGMDHGVNNPTAWLLAATDFDGNLLLFDEYHQAGLIADHAAEIWHRRRQSWWSRDGQGELVYATCFGDPSIRNRFGTRDITGRELSVETEYGDHGIGIAPGQNDRRAGYQRILELLHPDPQRLYPDWHPRHGRTGSPRLFVTSRCQHLLEQLRAASVKAEGKDALDIVDPDWESQHGHAHAALRYLCMGRYGPSPKPEKSIDYAREYARYDPDEGRRERLREMEERTPRDWSYDGWF